MYIYQTIHMKTNKLFSLWKSLSTSTISRLSCHFALIPLHTVSKTVIQIYFLNRMLQAFYQVPMI